MPSDITTCVDLHLSRETVVITPRMRDCCQGVYPVWYTPLDDGTWMVSSSAAALTRRLPGFVPTKAMRFVDGNWPATYGSWDDRVRRLTPGRCLGEPPQGWLQAAPPEFSLREVAQQMQNWVAQIEQQFPTAHHVLMVEDYAGLVGLYLKRQRPDRWILFSPMPMASYVTQLVQRCELNWFNRYCPEYGDADTLDILQAKIQATAGLVQPEQLHWYRHLALLAARRHEMIFWSSAFSSHVPTDGRVLCPAWLKNSFRHPHLSLYHSPDLHATGGQLRTSENWQSLAEQLAGRPIPRWPALVSPRHCRSIRFLPSQLRAIWQKTS